MARLCGNCAWGLVVAVLLSGCAPLHFAGKSPLQRNLNLKPSPGPEVLATPPKEARYSRSQFPEVAFRDMNSRFNKPLDGSSGIVRAQGMSAAGGGGMPGGGMSSGGMGAGGVR